MDWWLMAAGIVSAGFWWTVVKVIIGIGLVIFVHELGHFLAAKLCGVKVERFYVGFDLPQWSLFGLPMPSRIARFQWGETEYGIGIIPLGGYVKMLGQDDNPTRAEEEAARTRVEQVAADGTVHVTLDPRSYPAQSVLERMFIISAGIFMNLVFAVVFAAVAYRVGVWYVPCQIGAPLPGDPAWQAGWKPGDQIIQIGERGRRNEHLRFDKDLRYQVFLAGLGPRGAEPLEVLVRHTDGTEKWYTIMPRMRGSERKIATLGIVAVSSTTLHSTRPVVEHLAAGQATPPLEPQDRIVAVNNQRLSRLGANARGDFPADELLELLARHRNQPIQLQVERTGPDGTRKEVTVTVPPQPVRGVGLYMEIGPVVAIQPDSPAALAGIRIGDVLRSINGKPIANPLTLPESLESITGPVTITLDRPLDNTVNKSRLTSGRSARRWNGAAVDGSTRDRPAAAHATTWAKAQTDTETTRTSTELVSVEATNTVPAAAVELANARVTLVNMQNGEGDGDQEVAYERIEVTVEPRAGRITVPRYTEGARVAVDSLGLAFEVTNRVAAVLDESAKVAGLEPGCRVVAVRPVATDPLTQQQARDLLGKEYDQELAISEDLNWVYVHGLLQELPPGMELEVKWECSLGKSGRCRLAVGDVPGVFAVERGLVFRAMEQLHQASSWWEAAQLGWRETRERLGEVAIVLGLLVRGRLAVDNLAGPVRIAAFAGQEAAKGWPALLMFLTLLSANLALLNALPIPVLDGGHFLFLLVEGITRRPVPEKWQGALTLIGLACLLALIVLVSTNDVRWLFRWF